MHLRISPWCFLVTLAGLGACSSPNSSSSGPASADQACTDFATNYCNRLDACSHYVVQLYYGTVAACTDRWKPVCLSTTSATGSGLTPAQYEPCAQAYKSLSCDDLLSFNTPHECQVAGSLPNAAACGHNSQCASAYCRIDFFKNCGVCKDRVGAGATCTLSSDCSGGLECISPGTCGAPATVGQSCTTTVCAGTLACTNGTCAAPPSLGEPCVVNPDLCDFNAGLSCDRATQKCVPLTLAGIGAACAVPADGGFGSTTTAKCIAGSTCGTSNTCEAAVSDGAPCTGNGARCLDPAQCIQGVCTAPNASLCR